MTCSMICSYIINIWALLLLLRSRALFFSHLLRCWQDKITKFFNSSFVLVRARQLSRVFQHVHERAFSNEPLLLCVKFHVSCFLIFGPASNLLLFASHAQIWCGRGSARIRFQGPFFNERRGLLNWTETPLKLSPAWAGETSCKSRIWVFCISRSRLIAEQTESYLIYLHSKWPGLAIKPDLRANWASRVVLPSNCAH